MNISTTICYLDVETGASKIGDATTEDYSIKLESVVNENVDGLSIHSDEIERQIMDKIEAFKLKKASLEEEPLKNLSKTDNCTKENCSDLLQKPATVELVESREAKKSTGTSPPPQSISTQV